MFNNVGGKIKGVISAVTGILMFISIVEGIATFLLLKWELGFWAFIIGLIVAGVGMLFSWLANLVGYAFGQLVENSDRIREMMESSNGINNSNQMTSFDVQAQQRKAESSSNTPKAAPKVAPIFSDTTYVTCPTCKESQPAGKTYCNICGGRLEKVNTPATPAAPLQSIGNGVKTTGEKEEYVVCPKCGELQPSGISYCQICGGKIPTSVM